jgi:hypothetical protein
MLINFLYPNNSINLTQIACELVPVQNILIFIREFLEIIVIFIAAIWAIFKISEFREFKHWIQFEVDANIYPLDESIKSLSYEWDDKGERFSENKIFTHVLEILFKFTNKGKTRVKIYNIHAQISTLSQKGNDYLSKEDGHLRFHSYWTGNIVPRWKKFYYIEPQVEQIIRYLTLIEKPRDILKIHGEFCQDHQRIYPKQEKIRKYIDYDKIGMIPFPAKDEIFIFTKYFSIFSCWLCDKLEKRLIFRWDKVPGEDNDNLIKYLSEKFQNMDHLKDNKTIIEKSKKNNIINIYFIGSPERQSKIDRLQRKINNFINKIQKIYIRTMKQKSNSEVIRNSFSLESLENHQISLTLNRQKPTSDDIILEIDGIIRKNRLYFSIDDQKDDYINSDFMSWKFSIPFPNNFTRKDFSKLIDTATPSCAIRIYEKGRHDRYYGWIFRSIFNVYCRRLLSHTSERTFLIESNGEDLFKVIRI